MSAVEVKRLRETLGISQRELAERLGVTVTTVWRWENEYSRVTPPVAMALRSLTAPVRVPA